MVKVRGELVFLDTVTCLTGAFVCQMKINFVTNELEEGEGAGIPNVLVEGGNSWVVLISRAHVESGTGRRKQGLLQKVRGGL